MSFAHLFGVLAQQRAQIAGRQRGQLGLLRGLDARRVRSLSSIASSPKIAPKPRLASDRAPVGMLQG